MIIPKFNKVLLFQLDDDGKVAATFDENEKLIAFQEDPEKRVSLEEFVELKKIQFTAELAYSNDMKPIKRAKDE